MVHREKVLARLKQIGDPLSGQDIVSSGRVRALTINDGVVRFVLTAPRTQSEVTALIKSQAEAEIGTLEGVNEISILLTAYEIDDPSFSAKEHGMGLEKPKKAPQVGQPVPVTLNHPSTHPLPQRPEKIPGIERIIAIASGKGGVGKSTVSTNLAVALVAEGRRVGLLDADVYGPSQPRMLGVSGRPSSPDGKIILPLRNHGVTVMSMGLMAQEGEAVVWRGPMLMGALQQMLAQVQWGALDVLIIDLPPGTGDVPMTLTQSAKIDGAIVVSTPQDVALLDARKGIDMFKKLNTPILGMVENMSTHICSHCGHEEHLFGHGGVVAEAKKWEVPLLAEIPLHIDIRLAADGGAPIVAAKAHSREARIFRELANRLIENGHV